MRLGLRELIFSINSLCAAIAALYISLYCDLDRPYWAMMSVYVSSQPFSGATRSKAVYRLLGTFFGAAMTVLIMPPLANAPVLLSLALSAWIGGCLFFSLLDRTPRSYIFLLAGYTAAFIGFPAVNAPLSVFDTAVSRVEEIGIGVICSSFFHTVFFPKSLSKTLAVQLNETVQHLKKWFENTLKQETTGKLAREQHQLAADVTNLHMLATHIPFDTHEPARISSTLAAIQDLLIFMFPLITGLMDRIKRLEANHAMSEDIKDFLKNMTVWINLPLPQMQAERPAIQRQCQTLQISDDQPSWAKLLQLNLMFRLKAFIEVFFSCLELVSYFSSPQTSLSQAAHAALDEQSARPLHKDYGMAFLTGLATMGIIFMGCILWIETGWPEGDTAMMMASTIACLFASMPNPVPAQKVFGFYTFLASLVAGIYLFAILPLTHTFATMVLVLSPFLLVTGYFMARPAWSGKMLPFIIIFCGSLTLTRHFAPDLASFINRNCAQFIGISGVIFATRILYNANASNRIQRVLKAAWSDLAQISSSRKKMTASQWTSTMVDRIGLLTPYVETMKNYDHLKTADIMRDLRMGLNIIQLQEAKADIPRTTITGLPRILNYIGAYFHTLVAQGIHQPPHILLVRIDREITQILATPDIMHKQIILNALTGLRCGLFPEAKAHQIVGNPL